MSIINEAQQLEELAVIGKALIRYATSLEPGIVFERQDGWWLPEIDKNFIGFQFHWTNMLSITLSLYGSPDEQFSQSDLILKKGRFNYSRCRVTDENQLMAACVCIWRAHQLFHRERWEENGPLLLIDEANNGHSDWLPEQVLASRKPTARSSKPASAAAKSGVS
jgi:hypothetical protein